MPEYRQGKAMPEMREAVRSGAWRRFGALLRVSVGEAEVCLRVRQDHRQTPAALQYGEAALVSLPQGLERVEGEGEL